MTDLNALGNFYQLSHSCDCGSGLHFTWYKNEKQVNTKACDKCKNKLLYKIFDDKYLDFFENWTKSLFDTNSVSWYWVWEDFLKEKGCEQVKDARNVNGKILVLDPHEESSYILVPEEYAEVVLSSGKMV